MAGCGADNEANQLINDLTGDASFTVPDIDLNKPEFTFPGSLTGPLYQDITPITVESLTNGDTSGPGVFDALMRGFKAHLKQEYESGRITGNDYTKSYIALTESAMSQGVAFLLGKDQALWAAVTAQVQAFSARVQLETVKVQLASTQFDAVNQKANYALTKLKLSSESVAYCTAQYNLATMLPKQFENLTEQLALLKEQKESARGQTADIRTDGLPVLGVLGKQKDLYGQQITSYQRDAEVKTAKLFTDAWITQKTMDEGLEPPNGFTNASIDTILTQLKLKNGLN